MPCCSLPCPASGWGVSAERGTGTGLSRGVGTHGEAFAQSPGCWGGSPYHWCGLFTVLELHTGMDLLVLVLFFF